MLLKSKPADIFRFQGETIYWKSSSNEPCALGFATIQVAPLLTSQFHYDIFRDVYIQPSKGNQKALIKTCYGINTIQVNEGDIIYLPKGTKYQMSNESKQQGTSQVTYDPQYYLLSMLHEISSYIKTVGEDGVNPSVVEQIQNRYGIFSEVQNYTNAKICLK